MARLSVRTPILMLGAMLTLIASASAAAPTKHATVTAPAPPAKPLARKPAVSHVAFSVEGDSCWGFFNITAHFRDGRITGLTYFHPMSNHRFLQRYYFSHSRVVRVTEESIYPDWSEEKGLDYAHVRRDRQTFRLQNGRLLTARGKVSSKVADRKKAAELVSDANRYKRLAYEHVKTSGYR